MIHSGIGTAHWIFVHELELLSELSSKDMSRLVHVWETQPMIRVISKLEINYSTSSGDCT